MIDAIQLKSKQLKNRIEYKLNDTRKVTIEFYRSELSHDVVKIGNDVYPLYTLHNKEGLVVLNYINTHTIIPLYYNTTDNHPGLFINYYDSITDNDAKIFISGNEELIFNGMKVESQMISANCNGNYTFYFDIETGFLIKATTRVIDDRKGHIAISKNNYTKLHSIQEYLMQQIPSFRNDFKIDNDFIEHCLTTLKSLKSDQSDPLDIQNNLQNKHIERLESKFLDLHHTLSEEKNLTSQGVNKLSNIANKYYFFIDSVVNRSTINGE